MSAPAPGAERRIASYLEQVARRLPGPPGARRDVVDELRDGLLEAVRSRRLRGAPPSVAAREALAEFGPPEVVAAAFAPELAARQARRSAVRVVALLLAAGLAWLGYRALAGIPPGIVPGPGPGQDAFLLATAVIQYLPLVPQLGAIALLLACARPRPLGVAGRRRLALLGGLTTATLAGCALSAAVIFATSSPAVPLTTKALIGLPTAASLAIALVESLRATRAAHAARAA